ncbi:hypothetical protein [Lentilitoribacter sp. Alg239-R112]|uniref:hypothetical protein n=1 Tax=Lentilitoribacter sp. Alg239-R112 TaxID=2305987 RepID=UPI0013A6FF96|nr:hypothetical protein [Lentilitoribacter sp. Alg239-R112]
MASIKRNADGVEVQCYTDGHPKLFYISVGGNEIRITGIEKAEGLQYALGKVLDKLKERKL